MGTTEVAAAVLETGHGCWERRQDGCAVTPLPPARILAGLIGKVDMQAAAAAVVADDETVPANVLDCCCAELPGG